MTPVPLPLQNLPRFIIGDVNVVCGQLVHLQAVKNPSSMTVKCVGKFRMKMDEWSVKLGDFIYPLPNELYLAYKGRTYGEPQCENTTDDG